MFVNLMFMGTSDLETNMKTNCKPKMKRIKDGRWSPLKTIGKGTDTQPRQRYRILGLEVVQKIQAPTLSCG